MEKYSISDLAKCYTKPFGGIYVWGVKVDNKYFPLYVGKADNIPERIFQHLDKFSKGNYTTPSWKEITDPNRDLTSLRKEHDHNTKKDQVAINKVLDNFFCYWKVIPDYDPKRGERAESMLVEKIGKEKLISSKYSKQGKPRDNKFIDDFIVSILITPKPQQP